MGKNELINTKYLLMLVLLVFVVGCDIDFGSFTWMKSERTEQLSAPIAQGSVLTAESRVGSITVLGSDTPDCNITAKITARAPTQAEADELAGQVKIELTPADTGLVLEIEKPIHESKRMINIDLEITVPVQTNLRLESNVGDIAVSNITGDIYAATDVGKVTCSDVAGNVDLKANVGDVTARYLSEAESAFNASLETGVGQIRFTAPANLSATVDASTKIGSVETRLPITVTGKLVEHQVQGIIGEGTATVKLRANVGSIEIE